MFKLTILAGIALFALTGCATSSMSSQPADVICNLPAAPDAYSPANDSQTTLRGMEASDYAALFLEKADFPDGFEKRQNSQNDDKDSNDKKYAEFSGKRGGFNVWMTENEKAPVWRIVDVRLVFPSAENARKYLTSSLNYLSEGMKEDKQAAKIGEDCYVFGPENPAGKALGIRMGAYTYVFRKNNVVVKFFVAEGANSPRPLKSADVLPLAQKVLNRIR